MSWCTGGLMISVMHWQVYVGCRIYLKEFSGKVRINKKMWKRWKCGMSDLLFVSPFSITQYNIRILLTHSPQTQPSLNSLHVYTLTNRPDFPSITTLHNP